MALIKGTLDKDQERSLSEVKLDSSVDQKLARINKLKSWLDSFQPLPTSLVESKKVFNDVLYTYHSNAIAGNTLSLCDTYLMLEFGFPARGKTLSELLEVVGHKEAIDYVENLSRR